MKAYKPAVFVTVDDVVYAGLLVHVEDVWDGVVDAAHDLVLVL